MIITDETKRGEKMPDIAVHTAFGAEVLERTALDVDRGIYDLGLLGPDPYLFYRFYRPPFRSRANRYASTMHRERTGEFLMELARRAKDNYEVFSYLAGFLCHYALDSNTHPYINRKAKNRSTMHMAIEHRLDNKIGGEIRIPPFLPDSMEESVGGAITKVYGWQDAWEKLRQGHRDMTPFYRIVEDKKGRLDRVARKTHTKLALISYKSKSVDDMDLSGFEPLYCRALYDATRYIEATQAFINGKTGEKELSAVIGSRSYIDG